MMTRNRCESQARLCIMCMYRVLINNNLTQWPGGEYSHILAIRVCAAGKGMVFKPFGLVKGLVIIENWSRSSIGYMGLINKVDMVCLSPVGYGV